MGYWNGMAPNYSRAVEYARKQVDEWNGALLLVMQNEYPKGAQVRVVHHRGKFAATVVGWDIHGVRIVVVNNATGKKSKWWAAHVELMEDSND
jgi:hypothetical protein